MRVDKLQVELPAPLRQDPNAAAALQELLGGKYGEMSTLGNYMFQSFNFRSKHKLRPIYNLVAAITAEELGHVELVSNGVAMLNNGPDNDGAEENGGAMSDASFEGMKDIRLAAAFLSNGGGATPVNSNGSVRGTTISSRQPATWSRISSTTFISSAARASTSCVSTRRCQTRPAARSAAICWYVVGSCPRLCARPKEDHGR